MGSLRIFRFIILLFVLLSGVRGESCSRGREEKSRYLLYDVNPGEGFNLRRDVYLRIANLVRKLSQDHSWILVLPPWGNLYHWSNTPRGVFAPWSNFFDIPSLRRWIKVMEFQDYLKDHGPRLGSAYVLQHYAEGWSDGKWVEKYDQRPCIERHSFHYHAGEDAWLGQMWGTQLHARNFTCLSVQGQASTIVPLLTQDTSSRSVYVGRAETILHDEYGGKWYWNARRSMRFAAHLQDEALRFRREYLGSDNSKDGTEVVEDWRDLKPQRRRGRGGPYISVHLRRNDFIRARGKEVPSLKKAAVQIKQKLKEQNLTTAFIATDGPLEEFQELQNLLPSLTLHHYTPDPHFFQLWGDGGVAIVDQIICAHARYFIGSYESTFSFRIQEEREILGFVEDTTFNRLCGKNAKCEQPAKWKIAY